jgi:hypothetical protein
MLITADRPRKEDQMGITNGDVARRACELAEISQGQLRMAALCVSAAAATTGTFPGAHTALAIISHSGLRDAAELLLSELAEGTAAAVMTAAPSMRAG